MQTSLSVVNRPKQNRKDASASSADSPYDFSTRDGSTTAEEHADPDDT